MDEKLPIPQKIQTIIDEWQSEVSTPARDQELVLAIFKDSTLGPLFYEWLTEHNYIFNLEEDEMNKWAEQYFDEVKELSVTDYENSSQFKFISNVLIKWLSTFTTWNAPQ